MNLKFVAVMSAGVLMCTPAVSVGATVSISDIKKMEFLQEVRSEARVTVDDLYNKEAEEQAELALSYNLASMKQEEDAKKLAEKQQIIDSQERAVTEQGARYLRHKDDVDASALFAFNSDETDTELKLTEDINLEYNLGSNDGFAREYKDIFTKTVIPATWDADYYDVAIPYNLTCADVGGIAIETESRKAVYDYTAVRYADRYVGSRLQQEFLNLPINVAGKDREVVTDCSGVDTYSWNGRNLYAIALPKSLFPEALSAQGFYSFSQFRKTGILADMILTDGTIVNCVVIDGIGEGHSNGMTAGWTASSIDTAQDGVRYYLNDLKLPQYARFFHAASCHTVELSGDIDQFREYYGLENDVRISYIRIYKYSMLEEA